MLEKINNWDWKGIGLNRFPFGIKTDPNTVTLASNFEYSRQTDVEATLEICSQIVQSIFTDGAILGVSKGPVVMGLTSGDLAIEKINPDYNRTPIVHHSMTSLEQWFGMAFDNGNANNSFYIIAPGTIHSITAVERPIKATEELGCYDPVKYMFILDNGISKMSLEDLISPLSEVVDDVFKCLRIAYPQKYLGSKRNFPREVTRSILLDISRKNSH